MDTVKMEVEQQAEPTWEIAHLFPRQGHWSEAEYLALHTNRLIEFSHGNLEVLPMPSQRHQRIVAYLFQLLAVYVATNRLGEVLIAPFPVQLWPGKYREPDILFMHAQHSQRQHETYWEGADLVVELVSPDDPSRDWVTKREEYTNAGIPEYWIVDPAPRTVTVLWLDGEAFVVAGEYDAGARAASALLSGFVVDVDAIIAAGG